MWKKLFFEHFLFEKLKAENFKPLRVSLFGLSSLSDLSKNIICEYAQYFTENKILKRIADGGANLVKIADKIKFPFVSDYLDLKGIFGSGKALYKLLSEDVVICLDDLERAIEKYDINDLLGVINELVENQHLKVIVIANKEYIDKQQWSNDSATSAHDVFYEKVIEKVLHFTPDIVGVFETLIHSDGTEKSDAFEEFMNKECIKNSVSPKLANSVSLRHQKENIRTLKFAVSHFRSIFQNYLDHEKDITDTKIERLLINQWLFLYSLSLESKQTALSIDDSMGLENYVATASNEQIDLGDEMIIFLMKRRNKRMMRGLRISLKSLLRNTIEAEKMNIISILFCTILLLLVLTMILMKLLNLQKRFVNVSITRLILPRKLWING